MKTSENDRGGPRRTGFAGETGPYRAGYEDAAITDQYAADEDAPAQDDPRAGTMSTAQAPAMLPDAVLGSDRDTAHGTPAHPQDPHDPQDPVNRHAFSDSDDTDAAPGDHAAAAAGGEQYATPHDDAYTTPDETEQPGGTDVPPAGGNVGIGMSGSGTFAVDSQPYETHTPAASQGQGTLTDEPGPVLARQTADDLRERWRGIQAEFIDDPGRAVEDADRLVTDAARAFTTQLEERRHTLTSAWQQDGNKETEQLRLTMRHYRALVDQILHS
ncbi:hypothetical protein KGA66_28720 [Actinocrinis puniceicyclus]|uniref:Uncharacterized protein n=1 Tax=Actinocrinis puniceicyclus TaxID=977794 RepID=A0A8J7WR25_9ACTN|nr:hypothetical protein [Actinocrinis puniceicyclus]MBS2967051.1 hypothetical protein [Actinocrinis puniceicyclus]